MYFNTAIGYEETVSQVTATNSVRLGDRRWHDGEEYVYCYNAGGATLTTGLGVTPATAASGYSVAGTSTTEVFNPCVGVVKQTEIPTSEYGWIMTKGYHTIAMVSATTGDKVPIALGASGKFIEAAGGTGSVGTGAVVGVAFNANTGAAGAVYARIGRDF